MKMKLYQIIKPLIFFILCLFFMTVIFIYVSKEENLPEKITGNCFDNLRFIVRSNQHAETIHCFYNECEGENIYYLFLPSYSNLQNIQATWAIAEKIELKNTTEHLILSDSLSPCPLKANCTYNVQFYGNNDNIIESGKLKVLQSQNLPTMYIETTSGSLDYLNADKNNVETGQLTFYSYNGEIEYCDKLKQITGRGNETWRYDKRSYGIKLNYETSLENMGAAENWILLPNVTDDTYLRNKITYDMAISAGTVWAPESCFIDLYINNVYHGLYQLCEKLEIHNERINISNLELANKRLNPDQYNKNKLSQIFTDLTKYIDLTWNPSDISGGYLIERDYPEKYNQEKSGFQTSILHDYYSVKSPSYASFEEISYISSLFAEMEYAVTSETGINPFTQKSYSDYIDIDSFVVKYLIDEISKNDGGGASSAFYFKPEDNISEKIFAGPVWDYDKAYGSLRLSFDANTRDITWLTLNRKNTSLYRYLYQFPEFQQAVREIYQSSFSEYLDDIILNQIDELSKEIRASAEMDRLRWKGSFVRFDEEYDTLDDNIKFLKNFIKERKEFLDTIWIKNINDSSLCTIHFIYSEPGYEQIDLYLGVLKGETIPYVLTPTQDYAGNVFKCWISESENTEFDPKSPILYDMTVRAQFE